MDQPIIKGIGNGRVSENVVSDSVGVPTDCVGGDNLYPANV